MPLKAPVLVETLLKDDPGGILVGRQGQDALEDVTGRQGAQLVTEPAGAAPAVHHGNDGADADVFQISQAGQQGILAAAAADGDHMNLFLRFRSLVLHGFSLCTRLGSAVLVFLIGFIPVFQELILEAIPAGDASGDDQLAAALCSVRRGVKLPLPERFEQAIDRAAMKSGAAESDDYMAGFRKADPIPVDGTDQEAAEATVARIVAEYDQERIKTLIANDGWA